MNAPLTTPEFWNKHYGSSSWKSYPSRVSRGDAELMRLMRSYLERKYRGTLLEVGCGNSYWLPYFSQELRMVVSGVDFSAERLTQADMNIRRHGKRKKGELYCCDILHGSFTDRKFDVVCSFGFIEHFTDPAEALRSMSGYLKPNGLMLTTVPHLKGMFGNLSHRISREVCSGCLELDMSDMERFHQAAGLQVLHKRYFRWMDFGVINFASLPRAGQVLISAGVLAANTLLRLTVAPLADHLPEKYYADMLVVSRKKI